MVQDSSKMERDFLGLNQKYSSQQGSDSASEVIRPRPLTPSQFLSSKAPTRKYIHHPFPFGSDTERLYLAKNAWTLPTTNITPNSSTNVPNPMALNDFTSVATFARKDRIEDSSITSNIYKNNHLQLPEQLASLSMLYSGKVHVFQNISPEKVELIMRIASSTSTCLTADSNRTLDLIPKENNHGTNMQLSATQSSPSSCFARGGLAMARKATLARFLEKRMHRLSNARPYDLNVKFSGPTSGNNASSETNASPWAVNKD